MKRIISCILILMMLLAAIPASAEEKAASITFDAEPAVVGETIKVELWGKDLPKTITTSVAVEYDPQVLEMIGFESTPKMPPFYEEKIDGEYIFVWMDVDQKIAISGNVLMGTFVFKVLAMPESKSTVLKSASAAANIYITSSMEKEYFFTFEPFVLPIYQPHPFTDVKNQWFKEAVLFAHNRDLMNGVGDTTFAPNNTTTRAQLVTVLYRLEGLPQVVAASPFTDLTKNWYKDAVAWAFEQGIVNGKTATTFAPNAPITRQEIAAILYRYAQYKGFDTGTLGNLSVYPDADQLSSYAKAPMQWASAQGLITGVKKSATLTILSPKTSATRAQIATILMRFIQKNSEA